MPRIVIDCRFADSRTGLGTYTRELVTALLERNDPWEYLLLHKKNADGWLGSARATRRVFDHPHYSPAEQVLLPVLLARSRADLFFSPQFNVPMIMPVPFLCTVHDLILHDVPNHASFVRRVAYRAVFDAAIRRARRIIAVSHATASALHSQYPALAADRVSVVFPGVSERFTRQNELERQRVKATYNLPDRFLLYVGSAKEHKNLPGLLSAYRLLRSHIDLVLVTGGPELSRVSLPTGVRIVSPVADEDLPGLYSCATAFVTASLAEGFGLPVIEALACGCPTVAYSLPSFVEHASGRAVLVDVSEVALAEGIQSVLSLPPDREALSQGWHERYSWEHSAEQLAACFSRELH